MNRALVISAIVLVAVVMGISAVVPPIEAVPRPGDCQRDCIATYTAAVDACVAGSHIELAACIQAAVDDLRKCLDTCRGGGAPGA